MEEGLDLQSEVEKNMRRLLEEDSDSESTTVSNEDAMAQFVKGISAKDILAGIYSDSEPAQAVSKSGSPRKIPQRVADSDGDTPKPSRTYGKGQSTLIAPISSAPEDEIQEEPQQLSKREKLEQLKSRRVGQNTSVGPISEPEPEPQSSSLTEVIEDDGDSLDDVAGKKIKTKNKSLKRAELKEMYQETAALKRNQSVNITSRNDKKISISDVFNKHKAKPQRPVSTFTPHFTPKSTKEPLEAKSSAILSSSGSPYNRRISSPVKDCFDTPLKPVFSLSLQDIENSPDGDIEDTLEAAMEKKLLSQQDFKKILDLEKRKKAAAQVGRSTDSESDSDLEVVIKSREYKPKMLISAQKTVRTLTGAPALNSDWEVTDSQIHAAGRAFGQNFAPNKRENLNSSPLQSRAVEKKKKDTRIREIGTQGMNELLMQKAHKQSFEAQQKKKSMYVAKKSAIQEQKTREQVTQKIDVKGLKERIRMRVKDSEDEDEDDEDYQGGVVIDDDDDDDKEEECIYESAIEGVQTDEEGGVKDQVDGELYTKPLLLDAKSVAETPHDTSLKSPIKPAESARGVEEDHDLWDPNAKEEAVDFGNFFGGDGGFSQLFDEEDGIQANEKEIAPLQMPTFGVGLNVSLPDPTLEADSTQPVRVEMPTPARYINANGFFTQTRPENLFAVSQELPYNFSPTQSQTRSQTGPYGSQETISAYVTQGFNAPTEAQLDEEGFPIFLGQRQLKTVQARTPPPETLVVYSKSLPMQPLSGESLAPTELATQASGKLFSAEELAPIFLQRKKQDQIKEKQKKTRLGKSMFVDAEASLSEDEDDLFNKASDDESDPDHNSDSDAELAELVDNQEIDAKLQEEQNAKIRELREKHLEEDEEELSRWAERVAAGKARRRGRGLDLSDDEFDDDDYGVTRHQKKQRRKPNETIEELEANEETQAFGRDLRESLKVPVKNCVFLELDENEESADEMDIALDVEKMGTTRELSLPSSPLNGGKMNNTTVSIEAKRMAKWKDVSVDDTWNEYDYERVDHFDNCQIEESVGGVNSASMIGVALGGSSKSAIASLFTKSATVKKTKYVQNIEENVVKQSRPSLSKMSKRSFG